MEKESWRRNHGGEIMAEKSWSGIHVGVTQEEPWEWNRKGGISEQS